MLGRLAVLALYPFTLAANVTGVIILHTLEAFEEIRGELPPQ